MTLSRTRAQVNLSGWSADIGEINDTPYVFFAPSSSTPPQPGQGSTELQIPRELVGQLLLSLQNLEAYDYVFLTQFREDRLVQLAGVDPYPPGYHHNRRYEVRYTSDLNAAPLLTIRHSELANFVALVSAVATFNPDTAPGNAWDSTRSEVFTQYGFYPGLLYPSHPRAYPGFV